jgi:RNA polymerase sigma-70 factor (ECF subfamily)
MTQSPVPQALVEHRRWLATVLRARGVEASAVEELLQEVSATAVENAAQLRDPSKIAPWLYRLTVITALQHRRRVGRKRKLVERFAATQGETSVSAEPDPLAWLVAREQRSLVRQAIARLPAKDAEVLLLKHTEDWTYRQLSEHLGISESAVDARLHRARKRMRRTLSSLAPALTPH